MNDSKADAPRAQANRPKGQQFGVIEARVVRDKTLPRNVRIIYSYLALFADIETREAYPGRARSQARRASGTPTATRPIELDAPEEYYDTEAWTDGQAHRWLVKASVAAMRKAGTPLPTGNRDRVGSAVKAATERGLGRMRIITDLADHLNRAATGDPKLAWLIDPSNVRPPRPNFEELMRQLNPDEPEEALIEHLHEEVGNFGTDATVYSMGETHHYNAIVNTVRARDAS